ncbi:MAG: hypothetical protein ACW98Y_01000 [Candidatus Thorarchaeota archaeon]
MSQTSKLRSKIGLYSIIFLLLFMMFLTPYAVWISLFETGNHNRYRLTVSLVGMLWSIVDIGTDNQRIVLNEPSFMQTAFIFNSISLFFVIQVIRYSQSKTTFSKTIVTGIISLVPPILKELNAILWASSNGYLLPYLGPIPTLFVVGLAIMLIFRRTFEEEILWQ